MSRGGDNDCFGVDDWLSSMAIYGRLWQGSLPTANRNSRLRADGMIRCPPMTVAGGLRNGGFEALSGIQPLNGLVFLFEKQGRGVVHQSFHLQSEEGGFRYQDSIFADSGRIIGDDLHEAVHDRSAGCYLPARHHGYLPGGVPSPVERELAHIRRRRGRIGTHRSEFHSAGVLPAPAVCRRQWL